MAPQDVGALPLYADLLWWAYKLSDPA